MAEGWAKTLCGDEIEVYSAGVEIHGMNPSAVRVMGEAGVDISGHFSKLADDLKEVPFDFVVTVCDHARQSCPVFSGVSEIVAHSFDDPPALAKDSSDEEEALGHYRRVRDEIRDFIQTLPEVLNNRSQQNR